MDRSALGAADVGDDELRTMVAGQLGLDDVELLTAAVSVAEYDLDTLTTASRHHVRGTARTPDGAVVDWAFYVKVVQSWARHPAFAAVPEHVRELAAAGLPWRNEPAVYRSDLAERLPDGLTMPRARAVEDVDETSIAMWLDLVEVDPSSWDQERFTEAARLLGRLAARPALRPLRRLGMTGVVPAYADGRVAHQLLPALRDDGPWAHPVVAAAFDPALRARLVAAAEAVPELVAELADAPLGTAHGDACPRNLLVPRSGTGTFVLIDFGLWCEAPLGFDLSQLLIGDVQTGERSAAELPALERVCLPAYVDGLRDEGVDVPLAQVRRTHALLLLLFAGLSALPFEALGGPPSDEAVRVARERADAARWILDLVDATRPAS